MKAKEFITEGLSHPIICVDVQPEYAYYGKNAPICEKIINFVIKSTGPILFFVNAEKSGVSGDTLYNIQRYWEDVVYEYDGEYDDPYQDPNFREPIDWKRFQIVDKGFGYLRSWMDQGISPAAIIRVIRAMYQYKISDSRELQELGVDLAELVGSEWNKWMLDDAISVNWASVAQLKRFSGAYLVGGGRNECLREVELLMNAFNIKYKRIDSLVY